MTGKHNISPSFGRRLPEEPDMVYNGEDTELDTIH